MPSIDDMKPYYDLRAPEYDDWFLGVGMHAGKVRPGWHEELWELEGVIAALPPLAGSGGTLDVACGTGFLTRFLRGPVTGLDQSRRMIDIASLRSPGGTFVVGDGLALPFPDDAFGRVVTGHFYGHLRPDERERFIAEARRVATELVVIDSALRDGVPAEEMQERVLNDGSRHQVFKRYLDPATLIAELGGGETLHAGIWFTVVRSSRR